MPDEMLKELQLLADGAFRQEAGPDLYTVAIRIEFDRLGRLELYAFQPDVGSSDMRIGNNRVIAPFFLAERSHLRSIVVECARLVGAEARATIYRVGLETLRLRHLKPELDLLGAAADDLAVPPFSERQ